MTLIASSNNGTVPAGIQAGDFAVAIEASEVGTLLQPAANGWTELSLSSDAHTVRVMTKVLDADDGNHPGSLADTCLVAVYRGFQSAVGTSADSSDSTSLPWPDASIGNGGSRVLLWSAGPATPKPTLDAGQTLITNAFASSFESRLHAVDALQDIGTFSTTSQVEDNGNDPKTAITLTLTASPAGQTDPPADPPVDPPPDPCELAAPNDATLFAKGHGWVYDENGVRENGVTVGVQLTSGPGVAGFLLDTTPRTTESADKQIGDNAEPGFVEFAGLRRGATYSIWRGETVSASGSPFATRSAGPRSSFVVPDAPCFPLTEVLGNEPDS